jgi:molybdopterin synthase catalytic subunit
VEGDALNTDWIELTGEPLGITEVADFVRDPSAGGIAIFLGTTRGEANARGQQLSALDYEAYAEMAVAQLHKLAETARERWKIAKIVLLHRTGRVEVMAPSVAIAVSTPHRADAFVACQWLIDSLKAEATIWKQEVWEDGTRSWK